MTHPLFFDGRHGRLYTESRQLFTLFIFASTTYRRRRDLRKDLKNGRRYSRRHPPFRAKRRHPPLFGRRLHRLIVLVDLSICDDDELHPRVLTLLGASAVSIRRAPSPRRIALSTVDDAIPNPDPAACGLRIFHPPGTYAIISNSHT